MAGYYTNMMVWQKSMDLAVDVYRTVKTLPKEELYGLSDQMRRAVVSIPSNIAEGHQRSSSGEYVHFLRIAKGSLGELETQVILCGRLGYLQSDQTEQLCARCEEIGKMLSSLIKKLEGIRTQAESGR